MTTTMRRMSQARNSEPQPSESALRHDTARLDSKTPLELRATPCPDCGRNLHPRTQASSQKYLLPKDGDLALRVYCRRLLEFWNDGYRMAALHRLSEIAPRIQDVIAAALKGPIRTNGGRR